MDGWGTANRGVAWMEDEGFRGPRAAVYSALLMIASCNTELLSNELQLHIILHGAFKYVYNTVCSLNSLHYLQSSSLPQRCCVHASQA